MKKQLPRILCAVLLVFPLIGCVACGGKGGGSDTVERAKQNHYTEQSKATAYWIDGSAFTPVLRFVAGSDVHVYEDWAWGEPRLANLFNDIYAYSEGQAYNRLDAVILNGDLCETGTADEYERLMKIIQDNVKQNETIAMASFAGHEVLEHVYAGKEDDAVEFITSYTGIEPASHITINGFHFVVISNMYTDANLPAGYDEAWVADQFVSAAEQGDDKPIFTFFHHAAKDTVLGSASDRTDYNDKPIFAEEMEKYPQMVYFSSHYHSSIKHPLIIAQTKYTSINTGSVNYTCDTSNNYVDLNNTTQVVAAAGCHVIEVDAANRMRVMPYDLVARKFCNGTGANADRQMIYYIENPSDPTTWLYTTAREQAADKPVFAEDARIEYIASTQTTVSFRFPQATDNEGVECYDVIVKSKTDGTEIINQHVSSRYYLDPYPPFIQCNYTAELDEYAERASGVSHFKQNMTAGETYIIEIVAKDFWKQSSQKSLTAEFVCGE